MEIEGIHVTSKTVLISITKSECKNADNQSDIGFVVIHLVLLYTEQSSESRRCVELRCLRGIKKLHFWIL